MAGVLKNHGVTKGDTVVIYMPMIPETMVAMLACARIGAIHSVVFGGFAPKELAKRIEDAQPKLIFSASCGIEPKRIIEYKVFLSLSFCLLSREENKKELERIEANKIQSNSRSWMKPSRSQSQSPAPV